MSTTHHDPFAGLNLDQQYDALLTGRAGPRWPSEMVQKMYVGTNSKDLLRRSLEFVRMLEDDDAFKPGWRGLDYGCGWGRFGSLLLSKGTPSQLDMCDAWQKTVDIVNDLDFQNRIFKVSELLKPGEVPVGEYDVMLSFSVFTHLSPRAFETNIPLLLNGLSSGGRFYLTVRHEEFIDHKYPDRSEELHQVLQRDGFVFTDSGGDLGAEKVFGDMVIQPSYLERFVPDGYSVRYLGFPHTLQHVHVFDKA